MGTCIDHTGVGPTAWGLLCLQAEAGQKLHTLTPGHVSRLSLVSAAASLTEAAAAATASASAPAMAAGAIAPETVQERNGCAFASASILDGFNNQFMVKSPHSAKL